MKIILCFPVIFCLSRVNTQTFEARPLYQPLQPIPYPCPPNEKFVQCKQAERSCDFPNPNLLTLNTNCQPGCMCKSNSLRTPGKFGKCVLPHMCPVPGKCGDGEEYQSCTNPCTRTCENCRLGGCPLVMCGENDVCDCKSGFLRSERTGKCIPEIYCTKCNY